MKKYCLLIIGCTLLFSSAGVTADECSASCNISDAPAPALTEYFANIDAITDNIVSTLNEVETDDESPGSLRDERNRVIAGLNSLLSFNDYFGSFDYYISLPITNEVPQEVRRDHDRIDRITEKLTRILEKSEKRATAGTQIENVCNGISHCNLSDTSVRAILTQVINNNQKVVQLYRASVLERPALAQDRDIILVSDDFISQIEEYYNKDTLTACSSCEGGFMETIRESISNISFKNGDYKEGVQKWKDAWAMLRGGRANPGYERREAELLNEYLSSQGMQSEQSGIILDNLDRYNEGGLSTSDPLSNSSNYAQANIEEEANTFHETLLERFGSGEERIPNVELVRVDTQIQSTQEVGQSVGTIYDELLPFSLVQDTKALELQARIIRMHFDLDQSIKMLGKQVKSTEKLCDKQATGRGRCSFE